MTELINKIRNRVQAFGLPEHQYAVLGDDRCSGDTEQKNVDAAVLVPIVEERDSPAVLLTQRAEHLRLHGGQVSFPGGKVEQGDDDVVQTALRETNEEIGIDSRYVEVMGRLDYYTTLSGFRVTPVVGLVHTGFSVQPDGVEVDEAFLVPLAFFFDEKNVEIRQGHFRGALRETYVYAYQDRVIWGATAGMLVNLRERVTGVPLSARPARRSSPPFTLDVN